MPDIITKTGASIDTVLGHYADVMTLNDRRFAERVWKTDRGVYEDRLRSIGFIGLPRVLDAGCGYGQWSNALDVLNRSTYAVDYSATRVQIASSLTRSAGRARINFSRQSVERLAFAPRSFDAVFCYSVIYATDFRRTLKEFRRVLKVGGRLYVCANGIGWQVRNLLRGSANSGEFDHRRSAVRAFWNTAKFAVGSRPAAGTELILSSRRMEKELRSLGFVDIVRDQEGRVGRGYESTAATFFPGRYFGFEGVYEVLAARGDDVVVPTSTSTNSTHGDRMGVCEQ